MALVISRLIMLPGLQPQSAKEKVGAFVLDEIDEHIERVLEVATLLDERLTRDLRALGIEPDPDNFDNELVTADTCELAHCRNLLEEVHDMLSTFKNVAQAGKIESRNGVN